MLTASTSQRITLEDAITTGKESEVSSLHSLSSNGLPAIRLMRGEVLLVYGCEMTISATSQQSRFVHPLHVSCAHSLGFAGEDTEGHDFRWEGV